MPRGIGKRFGSSRPPDAASSPYPMMSPLPGMPDDAPQANMVIRRATPSDASAVRAITDTAYARYVPLLGRKPQPMTADHLALIANHQAWLLIEGGRPMGVLELIEESGCMLIYSVAVRPEAQGRGLGRRLLAWGESEAARAGHERIRLYTNARMEENLRLYSRLGYQETGRQPYLGSTLVHMAKTLTGGIPGR